MVKGKGFVIFDIQKGRNEKVKKPKPANTPIREMIPTIPSGFCQKDCDLKGIVISCRSSIG